MIKSEGFKLKPLERLDAQHEKATPESVKVKPEIFIFISVIQAAAVLLDIYFTGGNP